MRELLQTVSWRLKTHFFTYAGLYIRIWERGISIIALIFPLLEVSFGFGPKVFVGTGNPILTNFYLNVIRKVNLFYGNNIYLIFIIMFVIYSICARGKFNNRPIRMSKFARFNIIQAILLNIICSCMTTSYAYFPVYIRETIFGNLIANTMFMGMILLVYVQAYGGAYCCNAN